jgi:hypothetical protein
VIVAGRTILLCLLGSCLPAAQHGHPYAFAALSHAAIQMILVALVLPEFGPIVDGLDGDATLLLALWETQWHLISLS